MKNNIPLYSIGWRLNVTRGDRNDCEHVTMVECRYRDLPFTAGELFIFLFFVFCPFSLHCSFSCPSIVRSTIAKESFVSKETGLSASALILLLQMDAQTTGGIR